MSNDFSPRIGFVGAGRVGVSLGKYYTVKGMNVVGYYSRSADSAKAAATFTDTCQFNNMAELIAECDMIFLTVPDAQIESVWKEVSENNITGKYICHCSGAMSSSIFDNITGLGAFGYSIHPLYAINSIYESYKELDRVFFAVEGSSEKTELITDWIKAMGNPVSSIDSDKKSLYHASAVMASNLVIGLYHTAAGMLMQCGMEESVATDALKELFFGNCKNIIEKGTTGALTGPVDRNDITTIEKHLEVLQKEYSSSDTAHHIPEIYRLLSLELMDVAARKNFETDYSRLHELLRRFH
ncbi:MAG: DUF2520 domain-containing protein [Lachnospiraceae bacterium]|nr:DUF2520 domain-containing protein [Lachnospiraceae bacterium]